MIKFLCLKKVKNLGSKEEAELNKSNSLLLNSFIGSEKNSLGLFNS